MTTSTTHPVRSRGDPRTGYLLGVLAVALWSTAPGISGALSGTYTLLGTSLSAPAVSPFNVVYFLIGFGAAFLLIVDANRKWPSFRRLGHFQKQDYGLLAVESVALPLYAYTYYAAMMKGRPVIAHVITYLWPIFMVLLSVAFDVASHKRRPAMPTVFEVIMMVLALVGASFIAIGNSGTAGASPQASPHASGAYLLALGSAFFIALHFALLSQMSRRDRDTSERASHKSLSLATYLSFIWLTVFGIKNDLIELPSFRQLVAIAWLGVVVFAIGHFVWTTARSLARETPTYYDDSALATLSYMTPLVSAVLLVVFCGERIGASVGVGMGLVVLANVLLHARYKHTSASTGGLVAFVLLGILCFQVKPTSASSEALAIMNMIGVVFAVLVTFTLQRITSKSASNRSLLLGIGGIMTELIRAAKPLGPAPEAALKVRSDRVYRHLLRYDLGLRDGRDEGQVEMAYHLTGDLVATAESVSVEDPVVEAKLSDLTASLRRRVDDWLLGKTGGTHTGEYAANWLLGGILIVFLIYFREDGMMADLAVLALGSVVAFLLLILRDHHHGRAERGFASLMVGQRFFLREGLKYYLPQDLLVLRDFPSPPKEMDVRTEPGGLAAGDLVEQNIAPESRVTRYVIRGLAIASSLLVLVLLAEKHGLL